MRKIERKAKPTTRVTSTSNYSTKYKQPKSSQHHHILSHYSPWEYSGLKPTMSNPISAETHMWEKRLAVMLNLKRLAGATPDLNSGNVHHIHLCQVWIWLPTLALKPNETSLKVKNQGIRGPTKRHVSTKKFKKEKVFSTSSYFFRIFATRTTMGSNGPCPLFVPLWSIHS